MISMSWADVWALRLARHSLATAAPAERIADVVRDVCGIQAQVMAAAELSVAIRLDGATRQDIRAALWERRVLVKTYGIRGTIHLFAADELPLWMAALRTRTAADPRKPDPADPSPNQLTAILEAMRAALDSQCLTMKQLGDEIGRRVGAWAQELNPRAWSGKMPQWRMTLGDAALAGVLCYGPPQGSEVTFVRPDQWLDGWHEVDETAALAEVFRRYLRTYGPATSRDFAQWFSIPPRAARAVAAALADELVEVEIEETRALLMADDAEAAVPLVAGSVRLLPHFDCYVIGCHPRKRLLPTVWAERVPPRTTPSQLQTLLIDGLVAGLWERQTKGRRLEVTVEPFAKLTARQRELLELEAARIGHILEAEPTLTIGTVSVRPHL